MCLEKLWEYCTDRTGLLIILCNGLDFASTYYALTILGASELNPIAAWLISVGWVWAFLYKFSGTIITIITVGIIKRRFNKFYLFTIWTIVICYLIVYLNNIGVIRWLLN